MTVKYHKRNTNFQILNFLIGSCHTIDNAYFMCLELLEDRSRALDAYNVSKKRIEAKKMKAETMANSPHSWDRAEAEADLLEIENELKYENGLYEALMDEMAFIKGCIEKLEPHRKYKDMDLISAHEAAQREEWKLELVNRAENYMLTEGRIPADEFKTMRMHPDFKEDIYPKIKELQTALLLANDKDADKVIHLLEGSMTKLPNKMII